MIQYWLLCVLIHQISRPGFSNLPNFIPKSNHNKLVSITLIDFFYYYFVDNYNKTGHYISISNIMTIVS